MINDGSTAAGWHFTVVSYTFGATPQDIISTGADGKLTAGFGEGPTVEALIERGELNGAALPMLRAMIDIVCYDAPVQIPWDAYAILN